MGAAPLAAAGRELGALRSAAKVATRVATLIAIVHRPDLASRGAVAVVTAPDRRRKVSTGRPAAVDRHRDCGRDGATELPWRRPDASPLATLQVSKSCSSPPSRSHSSKEHIGTGTRIGKDLRGLWVYGIIFGKTTRGARQTPSPTGNTSISGYT